MGLQPLEYAPPERPAPADRPALGWFQLLLPPLTAVVSWPVGLFTLYLLGPFLSFAVMAACVPWAWRVSNRLAAWRHWERSLSFERGEAHAPSLREKRRLRILLFVLQLVGILLSVLTLAVLFRVFHWEIVDV